MLYWQCTCGCSYGLDAKPMGQVTCPTCGEVLMADRTNSLEMVKDSAKECGINVVLDNDGAVWFRKGSKTLGRYYDGKLVMGKHGNAKAGTLAEAWNLVAELAV